MAINVVEEERRVIVPFTATLDDGRVYRDALHMSASEYAASTAVSRRDLARDRARAWANSIDNPPPPGPAETRAERRARYRIARAEALEAQAAAERELAATEADTPDGA